MSFPLLLPLISLGFLLLIEPMVCHRGGGGHHGHGHGPPMPSFLSGLEENARQQFFAIVRTEGKTKGQVKAKLEEWAGQNGVEAEFEKFMEREREMARKMHDTAVGNLSGQALELFNKIWQVNQDDSLTFLQDCQQIRAAFEEMDPMVGKMVVPLLPPKPLPGPPPRGCQPIPGMRGGGCGGHGGGRHGGGRGRGGGRRKSSSSSEEKEAGQNVGEGNGPSDRRTSGQF